MRSADFTTIVHYESAQLTLVLIATVVVVLVIVSRSSVAASRSQRSERGGHMRAIGISAAALSGLFFLTKDAGFVVGIGVLLPPAFYRGRSHAQAWFRSAYLSERFLTYVPKCDARGWQRFETSVFKA